MSPRRPGKLPPAARKATQRKATQRKATQRKATRRQLPVRYGKSEKGDARRPTLGARNRRPTASLPERFPSFPTRSGYRQTQGQRHPEVRVSSSWTGSRERRGRQFSRWGRGARLTRRVREEYRVYSDRNATQNGAKRSGEQPVVEPTGAPRPVRRPADKAREGGIPGVFRPKRNDERGAATRFSRDASPAEPPPGELGRVGFTTGCLAGMHRRQNAARPRSPAAKTGTNG